MLTLGQIADLLGAELVPADQRDQPVHGIAPIEKAIPGAVTFLTDKKFENLLESCEAAAIICQPSLRDRPRGASALLLHKAPYVAFARLMQAW